MAAVRLIAYRSAGGKGTHEHRPIANGRSDRLAEPFQFADQLAALQGARIDPVGSDDGEEWVFSTPTDRVDDLQRSYSRVEVEARWRAGEENQVGQGCRCCQGRVVRCGVDNDVVHVAASNLCRPIRKRAISILGKPAVWNRIVRADECRRTRSRRAHAPSRPARAGHARSKCNESPGRAAVTAWVSRQHLDNAKPGASLGAIPESAVLTWIWPAAGCMHENRPVATAGATTSQSRFDSSINEGSSGTMIAWSGSLGRWRTSLTNVEGMDGSPRR